MGYYCTVPQCTSLAGKTKNVKFHRFPRDVTMADKWNVILKRGKPYTKYSKVCSLHFTQDDYNVTTMGQWKTLSKDAVPSQNLPKLNADGSVMVIRKSRSVKYRDGKKDDTPVTPVTPVTEKADDRLKWVLPTQHIPLSSSIPIPIPVDTSSNRPELQDVNLAYRVSSQTLSQLVGSISSPQPATISPLPKPKKQDAIMQTDPLSEEDDTQNTTYDNPDSYIPKTYDGPKDYSKSEDDYIPQTNEEYNSEAEKYALERKSLNAYEKTNNAYDKNVDYQQKIDLYQYDKYPNRTDWYPSSDSVELLRSQQHNLQMLQEQHRINENQNFFNENHIKQEIDISADEDKYSYERSKGQLGANSIMRYDEQRRLMDHIQHQVKQEPETSPDSQSAVGDLIMQPQSSPYHTTTRHNNLTSGYYEQMPRQPGPELLIMKQNALAAQSHLWQNTMKRPFFYSDSSHYNSSQLLHRCEDYSRILQ